MGSFNLENILGTKLPDHILSQIEVRKSQISKTLRDNDNLLYIANRTGWIRVISSVDVKSDISAASGISGLFSAGDPTLAKQYVLFGGVSAYKDNAYTSRKGFIETYNITGKDTEVQNYGYKPMPGITSARIVTQGKLGSVRAATINFKVNSKDQLDIIDKLYFKPGFSAIVEWGNTFFYKAVNNNPNNPVLSRGEDYMLDPFVAGIPKENLIARINQSTKDSQGNYDAMLGIITNFSFSFTKDGSYDCTLSIQALGVLGEGIRVNNANVLPPSYKDEVIRLAVTVVNQTQTENANVETGDVKASAFQQANTDLGLNANLFNPSNLAGAGAVQLQFREQNKIPIIVPLGQEQAYLDLKKAQSSATAQEQVNTVQTNIFEQYSSYLEAFLIGIKLHCFNKITSVLVNLNSQEALDSAYAYKFSLYDTDKSYIQNMFFNGALTNLVLEKPAKTLFDENALYSFNRALLEAGEKDRVDITKGLTKVTDNFKDIFNVYVLTCKQSQDLYEGAGMPNPSYIPLSFFFMLLNHAGLLYENSPENEKNVPIVSLDFDIENNLILCNPQTISVDPYKFLVKFETGKDKYIEIFRESDVDKNKGVFKDKASTTIWDPSSDKISPNLPKFRSSDKPAYKGKIMNVLINIDYLINQIKSHSNKDDNNAVYFKNLIESILFDLNKALGGYNSLRLAYSDKGNCFYISDDQVIPPKDASVVLQNVDKDYPEIPIYGKESLVEDLRLQTDMSTKLATWLAISANSSADYHATAATDVTSLSEYNKMFVDRYKPNLTANKEISSKLKNQKVNDTTLDLSVQFNSFAEGFYTKGTLADTDVRGSVNYYYDRMSKLKASDSGSKASLMIPISLNFTMDGLSGFNMGSAFTVSNDVLPSTFVDRMVAKKVGFIVTGTEHVIDANRWKTSVKTSMYYLKNISKDYTQTLGQTNTATAGSPPKGVPGTGAPGSKPLTSGQFLQNQNTAYNYLRDKGLTNYQIAAVMGAFREESGFNPGAFNANEGAIGIAQWRGSRRTALENSGNNINTITGQLNFFWQEAGQNGTLTKLKNSKNLQEAFNAMAGYERFYGYNQPGTALYEQRLATSNGYLNFSPNTSGGLASTGTNTGAAAGG